MICLLLFIDGSRSKEIVYYPRDTWKRMIRTILKLRKMPKRIPRVTRNNRTKERRPKSTKILSKLAALSLFHGTKYCSFEQSIGSLKSHSHSIGETKITSILQSDAANSKKWRESESIT